MRAWFSLAILISTAAFAADEKIGVDDRIEVIRGLTSEYATLKAPLPRSKKPLPFESTGQYDVKVWEEMGKQLGPAARTGDMIQITRVIWIISPVRAAGPSCLPISSHTLTSYWPVDSNGSGFFDRGKGALRVAYSEVRPRMTSIRSSTPIFSSAANAAVEIRMARENQARMGKPRISGCGSALSQDTKPARLERWSSRYWPRVHTHRHSTTGQHSNAARSPSI